MYVTIHTLGGGRQRWKSPQAWEVGEVWGAGTRSDVHDASQRVQTTPVSSSWASQHFASLELQISSRAPCMTAIPFWTASRRGASTETAGTRKFSFFLFFLA